MTLLAARFTVICVSVQFGRTLRKVLTENVGGLVSALFESVFMWRRFHTHLEPPNFQQQTHTDTAFVFSLLAQRRKAVDQRLQMKYAAYTEKCSFKLASQTRCIQNKDMVFKIPLVSQHSVTMWIKAKSTYSKSYLASYKMVLLEAEMSDLKLQYVDLLCVLCGFSDVKQGQTRL